MVVLSCLRPCIRHGARSLIVPTLRSAAPLIKPNKLQHVSKRGGGHTMDIRRDAEQQDNYILFGYKDAFYFYIMLGIIPAALIIVYSNVFIGQATLTDIPEGYTPRPEEYHKHPISRFFAKYFVDSVERQYEKNLQHIYTCSVRRKYRLLKVEVEKAMRENPDTKGVYFYNPPSDASREKQHDFGAMVRYMGNKD